jgi:hypothetical protein
MNTRLVDALQRWIDARGALVRSRTIARWTTIPQHSAARESEEFFTTE